MPIESPMLPNRVRFQDTAALAPVSDNAGRAGSDSATNSTRMDGIFPKVADIAARANSGSGATAMPDAANQPEVFQLIQTMDVSGKVTRAMKKAGLDKSTASQSQLMHFARQQMEAEIPFVAKQLAVLSVLMGAGDPVTKAAEIKVLDGAGDFAIHADRIAGYLSDKNFSAEQGEFKNNSGLTMDSPKTFCPMPNPRHVLMRALDIQTREFEGRQITGKPYADFLVPDTPKGQTVFPPADGPLVSEEQYAQLFGEHLDFVTHVHAAIEKDGAKNLQSLLNSNPRLEGEELESVNFAKAKPNWVLTATPAQSKEFVSRCSFPDGEWHIELPEKVLEQIEYSEKHSLEDPDKEQKFIFVQEMGTGDILLAVHLDTTFHHSTPLAGVPTATAGELDGTIYKDDNGKYQLKVKTFVNKSGHYFPSLQSMAALRDALIKSGLDPRKVDFTAITRDSVVLELLEEWNSDDSVPSRLPKGLQNIYSSVLNTQISVLEEILKGPSIDIGRLTLNSNGAASAPVLTDLRGDKAA